MNKHLSFWQKAAVLLVSVMGLIFFAVVIAFTTALALDVMAKVFPGPADWWKRGASIALFDGGVLMWFLFFIVTAKGVPQRLLALSMFVVDILGVVGMTIGGLYLGGQTLVDVPQSVVTWTFRVIVGAAVINAVALYLYKMTSPSVLKAIQFQNLQDNLMDEAIHRTNAQVQYEAAKMSTFMAAQMTSQFKWEMGLPMTEDEMKTLKGEVVEGTVTMLPAPSAPRKRGWLRRLFGFFGEGGDNQSTPITSELSSNEPSDQSANQETEAEADQ